MTKEPLLNKLIKRFYGVSDTLDEYQEKEINRIGQICFLILFTYNCVVSIIVAIIASKSPSENTLIGFLTANFLMVFLILPLFIGFSSKRLNIIGPKEVEKHELAIERRRAMKRSLVSGVFFMINFFLISAFIAWWFENIPFVTTLTSLPTIIRVIIASIVFTGFMSLGSYLNIKVAPENED